MERNYVTVSLCILKRRATFVIFSVLKFPNKVKSVHWSGEMENQTILTEYSLKNNYAKNYWNSTTTVKVITGDWVEHSATQCTVYDLFPFVKPG